MDETRLESTFAPQRVVKLDSYSEADLAVAALGPRGRDPLFARCLAFAHGLWTIAAARVRASRREAMVTTSARERSSLFSPGWPSPAARPAAAN